jgi:hypothetical protein
LQHSISPIYIFKADPNRATIGVGWQHFYRIGDRRRCTGNVLVFEQELAVKVETVSNASRISHFTLKYGSNLDAIRRKTTKCFGVSTQRGISDIRIRNVIDLVQISSDEEVLWVLHFLSFHFIYGKFQTKNRSRLTNLLRTVVIGLSRHWSSSYRNF